MSTVSVRNSGLAVAIISSAAFAMSGVLAKPLLDAGWSSGAAVLMRIGGSALLLFIPVLIIARRSRGRVLVRNRNFLLGYGVLAVAGTQLGFFSAIQTLPIGVALLIEYLAPVLVVVWLWVRRGQRPTRLTVIGAFLAMAGLALILSPGGGVAVDPVGVMWALLAMVCLVGYFLLSAHAPEDLPPVLVIGTGMVIGWVALAVAALLGLLKVSATFDTATMAATTMPWWVPALALVLIATVFAYLTGIVAVRRLGSRLASFLALLEVVFATGLAWLVLSQVPSWQQFAGGLAIIVGVVVVRLGEPPADPLAALPETPPVESLSAQSPPTAPLQRVVTPPTSGP